MAKEMISLVGRSNLADVTGADFFAADEHWNVDDFGFQFRENFFQSSPLSGARSICQNWLIDGKRIGKISEIHTQKCTGQKCFVRESGVCTSSLN